MNKPLKILCISHDVSATGAPKSLKSFVTWLKDNRAYIHCDLILKRGFEHPKQFINAYSYRPNIFGKNSSNRKNTFIISVVLKIFKRIYRFFLYQILKHNNYDIIYSNTIVNADVLEYLSGIKCNKIVHVRELQSSINDFGGKELITVHIKEMDVYIAITEEVANNLIIQGIPEHKIKIINNHIKLISADINRTRTIKQRYNIPENAFVIGGCGLFIWRKGFDIFLQLASKLRNKENVYFVWFGNVSEDKQWQIDYDIARMGLEGRFIIDSFQPHESIHYFSIFDTFILTSREEPFGLVGLEAALNEVPVICFENSGGQPGFVKRGAGFVVPYLDTDDLEQKVLLLMNDLNLRNEIGARGKAIVEEFYDIEKVAPILLQTIVSQ